MPGHTGKPGIDLLVSASAPGESMNHMLNIDQLLATSKEEFGRYDWDGTFAEYLEMVR